MNYGPSMLGWLCVASIPIVIGLMIKFLLVLRRRSSAETWYECPECGYDLRATPQRCPECGYVPPQRKLAPGRIDVQKLLETAPADEINIRQPTLDEECVVVLETDDGMDARTLQEHLNARGVACDVLVRQSSQVGRRNNYFQVVVWSGDVEMAKALVSSATVPEE